MGLAATSRWISQRSTTWATDLPWAAPIWLRVREQIVAALGERPPGLQLDAALTHELLVVLALEERMGFDLVDRGGDLVVVDQVDQPVGVKLATPDRLDQPLLVQVLHGPPGAVVVPEGLVDQVQVEIPRPRRCSDCSKARVAPSSPPSWTHSLVVTNSSSRAMPLVAMARPTASSFRYASAVSRWR